MNKFSQIRQIAKNESGFATYLTALFMGLGLLLTMGIFLSVIVLDGSRGLSQNASDAAALAGTGIYADAMSKSSFGDLVLGWSERLYGECGEPAPLVELRAVNNYLAHYQGQLVTLQGKARSEAAWYAQKNFSILDTGRFRASIEHVDSAYVKQVKGIPFLPTRVKVRTTNSFSSVSGQQFNTPAYADAIAYMANAKIIAQGVIACSQYATIAYVQYDYEWQITLIDVNR